MGSKQTGLKRKRSEISDFSVKESSDSSSFRLSDMMKHWNNGAYDTIYLCLLDEAVSGNFTFTGRKYEVEFWDAFTTELNNRIRRSIPDNTQFHGFTMFVVIKYGKFLKTTYNGLKGEPHKLVNFDYYEKCFKKCERCTRIPLFPNLETRSDAKRSYNCSPSTSIAKRGSGATTSGNEEISSRLAYFVSIGSLTVKKLIQVLQYFRNGEDLNSKTWLKLSEECQVLFLDDMFP